MDRKGTLKKLCAAVTAAALVFQWSAPLVPSANAAGFVTSIVTRTPSNGLTVPWSSLSFTFQSTNFTGGPVTNPFIAVGVAQSEFTYVTASWGFAQTPTNTFYPTSGFNPPTSATGTISATVQNAYAFWISKALFTIPKSYPHPTFDVTAVWGVEWGESSSYTATVKVDVFPHVSSTSLSKASIVNNGIDSTNLTVTVIDKNGCSDLQWGSSSLTLDLTAINWPSAKAADSVSCNGDVATVSFNGITSTASAWGNAVIRIVDAAWHVAGSGDSAFSLASPEISTVYVGVQMASAPEVTVNTPSASSVSVGANEDVSVNWQSSQSGSYAIYAGPSAACWSWTAVISWSALENSPLTSVIPASNFQNGQNLVFVCVTNSEPTLGQRSFSVSKDAVAPDVQIVSSPAVVGANDPKVSFVATESGSYSVYVNGVDIWIPWSYPSANVEKEVTVPNAALTVNPGANAVKIRVADIYGNFSEASVSVTKDYTPPSPVGSVTLEDCDYVGNSSTECEKLGNPRAGMTGRDFHVNWTNPPASESGTFLEYRVFVLPTGTSANPSVHQILATVSDFSSTGTVVSNTFAADSSGTVFPSSGTWNYQAWVYAYKKNGLYSTAVSSSSAVITADAITYPTFVSAAFKSGTWLDVTFSKPLSANLSDFDSSKLSSASNCFLLDTASGTWAASVSWSTVTFLVESLSNPAKTCSDLSVLPWLAKDAEGLSNEDTVTAGSVSDAQKPAISVSSPTSGAFIAGNGVFTVLYSLSEAMDGSTLFANFTDGSWAVVSASLATAATAGNKSKTFTGSSIGLLDWRTYSLVVSGQDVHGNSASSSPVSGIVFDVTAPSVPTLLTPAENSYVKVSAVPLSWAGSVDNSSSSLAISYEVQVSQFSDFSVMSAFWSVSGWTVSYSMNPGAATNTGYYWRVRPTDEAGNVGTWSASKTFFFDNVAPTISELPAQSYVWNVTRSFSGYVRSGDSVELRAAITDNYLWTLYSTGVSANLSGFWAGASVAPSSFSSGNAAWSFSATCSDATISSAVSATDLAGNVGSRAVSAVCDNTAPSVQNSTLTSPSPSAYVRWGSQTNVTWNTAFYASEVSPVANPVTIETSSDGGNVWQSVATSVSNGGTAAWTVPNVDTSNFKIRLSATDKLSNVASGTVTVTVDSTDPSVASDALAFPNGGEYLKGSTWTGVNVVWNPSKISDANLADSPVSIDYTLNGTDWTSVASNLPNSGSYVWTTGAIDSNSARVRVTATDKAWRTSSDVSDAAFSIDSTLPTVTPSVPPTPPSGSFLSASGFDMGVSGSDVNLAKVSYSITDGAFYWNASSSSWLGGVQWNDVCVWSAACAGATDVAMPTVSDGSSYQFAYRATDRAGNVRDSSAFTYVADTLAPTLSTNVSSGAAFSGAVSVAWTSSDARSGVSSVRASVKRLSDGKYWGWTAFDQAGENLLLVSTSDSYATWSLTGFSIPSWDPDGTTYLLNIKWTDKAYRVNNESSTGSTFVKDSTGPSIASDVWTYPSVGEFWKGAHPKTLLWNPSKITDAISGVDQVSWISIEYATGAGIWNAVVTSYANSGSVNWTVPVMDADITFRISAKDALGNVSAWVVSPVVTVDTLQPQISLVETMDRAASGKIDGMLVTMSEPIACSTLRPADFTVAWVGTPSATSGCAGNSQTFVLEFSPFENTASTPWLTYSPSGTLEDRAGNSLSPVSKASVDKAVPRLLSAAVLDVDGNGKIDRIRTLFSENLSATSDVSAWTLSNVLPWMGTSPVSASVSASWATLVIAEPTGFDTSTGGIVLAFAGWSAWKDSSNNASAPKASTSLGDSAAPKAVSASTYDDSGAYSLDVTFSEPLAPPSFSGWSIGGTATYSGNVTQVSQRTYRFKTSDTTSLDTAKPFTYSYAPGSVSDASGNPLAAIWSTAFADAVAPKALSRKTRDADGDGKIDSVTVGFSETMNGNVSGTVASVSGYSVSSYASSGTWLTASLVERAVPDTDSAPALQLTNVSLADASGNVFASEVSPTAATDAVWPVVTSARYDSAGKVVVTVSEPYSGTPANDWFSFSGTSVSVSSASALSPTEVELNVSGTVTYGTTAVSAVPAKVKDALLNAQSAASYVKISASVVINEVMWSNSGSSLTQYVELRNLGPTPIDISGFLLDAASANGTATLVLPASQSIAGNGYYLVAASAVATAGNLLSASVTPDYVWALSLSTSQTSNLVLKNASWSVYDRAKANPFPAWDSAAVVSMERKDTPGDGLTASNWYSAQTGASLFDTVWPKGTPRQANVFDATAPVISSASPAESAILAKWTGIVVAYDYSDDVLIQSNPVRSFKIEKNDGAGNYSDVTSASVVSSWADASRTTYSMSTLSRWAYRTTYGISDSAGNQTQKISNFYVDAFAMDVSSSVASIWTLDHQTVTASAPVTVTVTTVGAPFDLSFSGGTLSAWYDTLVDWNGSSGFAFECSTSLSAGWTVCDSTKRQVSQTSLETLVSPLPDSNGNLKTYVYEITFSARPDELNAAWTYVSNARVSVSVAY